MNEKELKEQYEIFAEAWRFYKKWALLIPLNDDRWQQVIEEAGKIREKCRNEKFAKYLMMAVIENLDETEKKMKTAMKKPEERK